MKKQLTFLVFLFAAIVSAQETYLQCGRIIDVDNGTILTEKTIVVSGSHIKSILDGYKKWRLQRRCGRFEGQDGHAWLYRYACSYRV